jgi:transcriptional regulator with XRE-family HTH domain
MAIITVHPEAAVRPQSSALQRQRLSLGYSQREIAERAAVSVSTVRRAERGECSDSLVLLLQLVLLVGEQSALLREQVRRRWLFQGGAR